MRLEPVRRLWCCLILQKCFPPYHFRGGVKSALEMSRGNSRNQKLWRSIPNAKSLRWEVHGGTMKCHHLWVHMLNVPILSGRKSDYSHNPAEKFFEFGNPDLTNSCGLIRKTQKTCIITSASFLSTMLKNVLFVANTTMVSGNQPTKTVHHFLFLDRCSMHNFGQRLHKGPHEENQTPTD